MELKKQLIESLGEHVPDESAIDSFNVGYLLKPSQSKQWITCSQDLQAMYNQSSEGETISLWCDQRLPVVEELSTQLIMIQLNPLLNVVR